MKSNLLEKEKERCKDEIKEKEKKFIDKNKSLLEKKS